MQSESLSYYLHNQIITNFNIFNIIIHQNYTVKTKNKLITHIFYAFGLKNSQSTMIPIKKVSSILNKPQNGLKIQRQIYFKRAAANFIILVGIIFLKIDPSYINNLIKQIEFMFVNNIGRKNKYDDLSQECICGIFSQPAHNTKRKLNTSEQIVTHRMATNESAQTHHSKKLSISEFKKQSEYSQLKIIQQQAKKNQSNLSTQLKNQNKIFGPPQKTNTIERQPSSINNFPTFVMNKSKTCRDVLLSSASTNSQKTIQLLTQYPIFYNNCQTYALSSNMSQECQPKKSPFQRTQIVYTPQLSAQKSNLLRAFKPNRQKTRYVNQTWNLQSGQPGKMSNQSTEIFKQSKISSSIRFSEVRTPSHRDISKIYHGQIESSENQLEGVPLSPNLNVISHFRSIQSISGTLLDQQEGDVSVVIDRFSKIPKPARRSEITEQKWIRPSLTRTQYRFQ